MTVSVTIGYLALFLRSYQFEAERKYIGVISEKNSYTKEVNIISWNGRPPVCDIRGFRVDKEGVKHPLKGISMSKADLVALKELLSHVELEV